MKHLLRLLYALSCLHLPLQAADLWVEGEDARGGNHKPHPWWYDKVKADALSGGKWISHFSDQGPAEIHYALQSPGAGTYTFWLRANHVKSQLSYALGDGPWTPVDFTADNRGATNIAADDKPDLRFISWNKVGKLQLPAGEFRLRFRFHSKNSSHGAIDCFVLTDSGFVPSGTAKPVAGAGKQAAEPERWFAFSPDTDPLSSESVIDMSRLVSAPAGQFGFLQAKGKDLQFERADKPVKFWAIGSGPRLGRRFKTPEEMEQAARWYRKYGINLVRQHTVLEVTGLLRADGGFDPERMDVYDRWFATLKAQGIYSCWSVNYPHHQPILRKSDSYHPERFAELDARDTHHDGAGGQAINVNDYVNLDPELQDILWRNFEVLLEHVNPYTGLAYKDDPALAVLECQNESNLFFHTLNDLHQDKPPSFARLMRQAFHSFCLEKYERVEALQQAWGGLHPRDKPAAGELALMAPFHWGPDGPLYEFKGQLRRAGDYIEFLAKRQRAFYKRRIGRMREAGFKGVTVTTAWKGVGASSLANLWTDTAGDAIDRHNYFGGGNGRHSIIEGAVNNDTHLSQPGRGLFALGLFQVADKPFFVSEWSMMPPNPWKAEAAPIMACYGLGLQGWDISYHFTTSALRYGDGWPSLGKYSSHTPHYFGQFPALAFAVHHNHFREGEVVAERSVHPEIVFSGKDTLGQSIAGEAHDAKDFVGQVATDPKLFAVGRITTAFDGRDWVEADVRRWWKQEQRQITASTGELFWDYGRRVIELRSAKTQGLVGFVAGHEHQLPAVHISDIRTPFVSLLFTPLDNRPLASARRILITALARDKQSGAQYNEDWSELTALGSAPLLLEPVQATLRFAGSPPLLVRPCDLYGVPRNQLIEVRKDGSFRIDGTHEAFYYLLER